MLSEQSMGYSFLWINQVNHPIGIFSLTGSEDNYLVKLWHFKEESIETETFGGKNTGAFAIENYIGLEVKLFRASKDCMYECLVKI